jgi:hypothetical protein
MPRFARVVKPREAAQVAAVVAHGQ